jgi:predicted  nucleic acid-binding Zn-ribbon protein
MVAELIPDIQKNMHIIAQEEVEVEDLHDQIVRTEKNLGTEKQKLLKLCSDIDNNQGKFRYSNRAAKPGEVKGEVARRFERFQTAEATLKAKRQMLDARQRSLVAAREKLEGMFSAKRDLEVEVQNLEARLKMLQAAQTTSQFNFDDSHLSRCKKTIQELRKRLDVAERILDQDGKLVDSLSDEAPEVSENIVEQVQTYFGVSEVSGATKASL